MTINVIPKKRTYPVEHFRWPRSFQSETIASDHASASCYRVIKDIHIFAVVKPELKFSDVQRKILGRNLLECTYQSTFEDTPKALDCLSVNRTDNILAERMVDARMLRELLVQMLVADPFIGANLGIYAFDKTPPN